MLRNIFEGPPSVHRLVFMASVTGLLLPGLVATWEVLWRLLAWSGAKIKGFCHRPSSSRLGGNMGGSLASAGGKQCPHQGLKKMGFAFPGEWVPVCNTESECLELIGGDQVLFIYPRGERQGQWRTIKVQGVRGPAFNERKIDSWDYEARAERTYFQRLMYGVHVWKRLTFQSASDRHLVAHPDACEQRDLAAPGSGTWLSTYPLIQPLSDGEIFQVHQELSAKSQKEILASHYTFDDPGIIAAYVGAAKRGVCVRILLDDSQMSKPSCKTTHQKVLDLCKVPNLEMRIVYGTEERHMCHQKTLMVDEGVCIIGSANATKNSREHAFEYAVLTTEANTVVALAIKLRFLWNRSSVFKGTTARSRHSTSPSRGPSSYQGRR